MLLPKGSVLYEEGANFIHGENREYMIEDSPDSSIVIPADGSNDNNDIALEIKCPYLDDTSLDVHYKIPVYYALQLLCHMKSKDMKRCWYTSYSEQSVVVLELKMQEDVWMKCFDLIKDQYDKEDIKCPKNKMKYKEELKIYLQTYIDENLKIVAEVPSMKVHEDYSELHMDQSPYYVPEIECLRNVSDSTIATKLKAICRVTKDLVSEVYELQRRKATEILAFVISDMDSVTVTGNA